MSKPTVEEAFRTLTNAIAREHAKKVVRDLRAALNGSAPKEEPKVEKRAFNLTPEGAERIRRGVRLYWKRIRKDPKAYRAHFAKVQAGRNGSTKAAL